MDSSILVPPLFPMQPEFEALHDGKQIRVLEKGRVHLGTLLMTHQREHGLCGGRIQFGAADVTHSAPAPFAEEAFVSTGHAGMPIHLLSLDELRRIQATGDLEVPFTLEI